MNQRAASIASAGLACVAIFLAGCGGASQAGSGPNAAVSARVDHGMVRFAHCMRAHGIHMADPFHRPGHQGLSINLPEQGPATTAAYTACGHFLRPLIEAKMANAPVITPAMRLGLIHYAECMREHGIAMLDPTAQGSLNLGNVPGLANSPGRYSPQFGFADHACRHLLPARVRDNGTGP
jgi:hypothetical protein